MIIYRIMKFLRWETLCKKIESKYEEKASKIMAEIPEERECGECPYGKYIKGDCVLACGFECRANPLKPISLGLMAKHSSIKKMPYIFDSVFPNEEVMNIALKK